MNIKTSLAIAAVVMGLGATSVAMDHGRGRDRDDDRRGNVRLASWHGDQDRDDHDRKGYEKGKKKGWKNGSLPPGQAKSESREWRREHQREGDWRRDEAREREREAREHRHRSHEVVIHRQPRPTANVTQAQRQTSVRERAAAVERARKEHKAAAQVNHK